MSEHLLLVSIGPVQDFIAAARRCQDLWFGSFLLSELAGKLAQGMEAQGAMLIFPGTKGTQAGADKPSVANKVVVRLPGHLPPSDAVRCGKESLNQWLSTLQGLAFERCEKALARWRDARGSVFYRSIAEKQVEDLIELQWVAVPLSNERYAQGHAQAERLLAWRKNTRDFGKVPWADLGNLSVPKSSIDGQRESVIDERFFNTVRDEVQLGARYRLGKNERLCGVGVLKRFGLELIESEADGVLVTARRPIFHSNSHVAAGPLLTYLSRLGARGEQRFRAYVETLRDLKLHLEEFTVRAPEGSEAQIDARTCSGKPVSGEKVTQARAFPGCGQAPRGRGFDGYLLYQDRLPSIFDESSLVPQREQREKVADAQKALRSFLREIKAAEPPPYYVILAADGDHMGAAIRSLAAKNDPILQHQRLSAALALFAASARTLVETEHAGSLIYSGGDDVLALLPLHTALHCARALQRTFAATLAEVCAPLETKPTLSVGLAVVHHLQHMGVSRALAQDAERLAKQERNSLAIIVDKRSGGTLSVSGKWDEASAPLDERLAIWCELLGSDDLPDGIAYELAALLAPFEVRSFASPTAAPEGPPAEVIASLVRRATARKRRRQGKAAIEDTTEKLLHQALARSTDPIQAVRALASELQIAREFLAAYKIAWRDA